MKLRKFTATFLAVLMIAACLPFCVYADETITGETSWTSDVTISTNYTITGTLNIDATVTIPSKYTITVANGGDINIDEGTLIVQGELIIESGGSWDINEDGVVDVDGGCLTTEYGANACYNQGTIIYENDGTSSIWTGTLYHKIGIQGYNYKLTYDDSETYSREDITVTYHFYYLADNDIGATDGSTITGTVYNSIVFPYYGGDDDDTWADYYSSCPTTSVSQTAMTYVWAEDGSALYLYVVPDGDDTDWIDMTRAVLDIDYNDGTSTSMATNRGIYNIYPTTCGTVYIDSYEYEDLVHQYTITLGYYDGYAVVGSGGEMETCVVEYGTQFKFYILINDDYDLSDYYVYVHDYDLSVLYDSIINEDMYATIYDTVLEADAYGYYTITGYVDDYSGTMESSGGVQQDLIIKVGDVQSNDSINLTNGIVGLLQEIFTMIQKIFEFIAGCFTGDYTLSEWSEYWASITS